jgi:surface protein
MDLSTPLKYGDITQVDFSTIQNVLFVNTAAQSLIQYVKTDNTFAILYDNTSTTDEVIQCFRTWFPNAAESSLNRIGFAFHYGGSDSIPFMNQQPLFTDSDLGDSAVVFSPNMQFMLDLLLEFRTVTHLDFLACGTLLNDKCKQYYDLLQVKTGVVIGASSDNTGNIQYGGDWIMESTHEDIEFIYFTAGITNWASLLVVETGTVIDNTVSYVWSLVTGNAVCSGNGLYSGASYTILSSVTNSGSIYPVTEIAASAFFNCAELTSITIPPSVVNINNSSFKYTTRSKLVTVTFSDISSSKLTNIYSGAFSGTKMTHIWLPYNLSFVGTNIFADVSYTVIVLPNKTSQPISFGTTPFGIRDLSSSFFVYTSSDLGATFNYNKFIGSPAVTFGSTLVTAYAGFSTNKLDASIWQPITSMAILSGTRYVNGSYYVYQNASFDVSFTKIIPGTTYTSIGSLSTTSTNTMLTSETTQVTFLSSSSTVGPIVLSMSDNSPPLTINNVIRITQSNIKDATTLWSYDTPFAITKYGMISDWDVSGVTDMSGVFYNASTFNADISLWTVSNVTNMSSMFYGAAAFSADISGWTVSNVTDMSYMFNNASAFNSDISKWTVSQVTNMSNMFNGAAAFNANISLWTVSNVTNMSSMFYGAAAFSADISGWTVSNVTDMSYMFNNASAFNSDISKWTVSQVTNMSNMFNGASAFNSDISGWTVSQVKNMSYMFDGASAFNANISDWNVGNVTNMIGMFYYAVAFNQNLSKWNVQNIPSLPLDFMVGQTIPILTGRLPLWGTTGTYLNNFHHTFYTMSAATPTILTRTIYDNVGNLTEIQDISFGGMAIADVLSLLDGGAGTNPYTIGTIDASANRISMDIAYCNVYTQALTSATQKRLLMTDVNTKYKEPHTAATTTYIVTVSGDAFWLSADGGVSTNLTPSCFLLLGNMYVFDQSDFSNNGYPLTINTDINNTVRYSPGVLMNGTPGSLNAYTLIDLSNSGIAVDTTLYYGVHGSTGGILHTSYPLTTYVVTVSGGVFWLNNLRQLPTMISGSAYLFDQSDSTNSGNTLVLGASLDSSSYYSSGVTTNGTAGSSGAYTYLSYSGQYQTLSCYSSSRSGMGLTSQAGAPSIISTTSGAESATVVVAAPLFIGGGSITGYTVTAATLNGGIYYPLSTPTTSTSSTIIVSGLTAGISYYFKFAAQNSLGETGLYSAYTTVATIPTINPIVNFNIVGVGADCFTCTWKTPVYAVTTYSLVYNDGTSTTNIPATSLTQNVQYDYLGYTQKNIIDRPSTFSVMLSCTDANGNYGSRTKTVENSSNAFSSPTSSTSTFTASTVNSFNIIKFTAGGTFTIPVTATSNIVGNVAVILVGSGGDGSVYGGGNTGNYEAGGGSGGGVSFYPLLTPYSVQAPTVSVNVTVGGRAPNNTRGSAFDTYQVSGGINGNCGPTGPTPPKDSKGGLAVATLFANGYRVISGKGGDGQNTATAVSPASCRSTTGISLNIPELDTSYNFSGGGGGGVISLNDSTSLATFRTDCAAIKLIYGCGRGGIGVQSATGTTTATPGTINTGGGGGGAGENDRPSGFIDVSGGSGVVYIYYSSYYFTVG